MLNRRSCFADRRCKSLPGLSQIYEAVPVFSGYKSVTRVFLCAPAVCSFKAKSTTGGDVQGKAKVEPYAYWQFDRKVGGTATCPRDASRVCDRTISSRRNNASNVCLQMRPAHVLMWPQMLNRRAAKKRQASKTLGGILGAAQAGAVRGAKAKARAHAKRARNE
jgi:hypothetical protein